MNEPLDTAEAPRKPSFLSWCFWILGPALVVWLGLAYFHVSGRFTAWALLSHGLVWVPTAYAALYLLVLMIRRRWSLLWCLCVVFPVVIIGSRSQEFALLAATILSAPALLVVRIFLDPFGPELMVALDALGAGFVTPEFAALIVYGAPLSGFGLGCLAGALLGWGQIALFDHRGAEIKAWLKANFFGGGITGLTLGCLYTFFVLTEISREAKLIGATIFIAASFAPHLWLTWQRYSPTTEPTPVEIPNSVKFAGLMTLIFVVFLLLNLGDRS